ncbi:Inositol phosphosphingolipids phospholipase C [Colletotrichum chlorophyti]|uniref:Inositol phosphosphingolipids phospholipase C n=1 Tax=Colletotrichum chlorophyti TaxID=708187 RepID=A0A1Q8S0Y8_9PEZI|nr:Inositol phosphosphingolipids phospholipase C [Colletotrichum chlorophyti]
MQDSEDPPSSLRLLTLNCWGLKYISKLRPERLAEIGRRIASLPEPPHIVALQECWVTSDYDAIRAETSHILPHGKFYYSGPFGGGLAILSRWPITSSSMHRYPLNGRPTAFFRGDWFVGKGIAHATITLPGTPPSGGGGGGGAQTISIFNTHTHAPYTENRPGDTYLAHRLSQSWELSKLLKAATERGHLVLALGDFNMRPLTLPHTLITSHAPVHDAWRVLHPESSLGAATDPLEVSRGQPAPTAAYNLAENGATSDTVYNTWRWPKSQQKQLGEGKPPIKVPPDTIDRKGKRLDYIFLGNPVPPRADGGTWVVRDAAVGMVEPHPTLRCSLSDHFSVEAMLTYHVPSQASGDEPSRRPDPIPRLTEQLEPARADGLPVAVYDEILSVIRAYVQREEKQRYWRGSHFFAWLIVLVGCLVAVWFSPHNGVAFVLVLLSSLGLVAGVLDGLMSLLFFNSELRALKEFEWEITNAKRIVTVTSGKLEETKLI